MLSREKNVVSDIVVIQCKRNIRNLYLFWFGSGFIIAMLSNINIHNYSAVLSDVISIYSIQYYYERSNSNYAITILFWFYMLTAPYVFYLNLRYSIRAKIISIPAPQYSLVLVVVFFVQIFFVPDTVSGSRLGDGIFYLVIMSWFSTFILFSCLFYLLFETASSLINYLKK